MFLGQKYMQPASQSTETREWCSLFQVFRKGWIHIWWSGFTFSRLSLHICQTSDSGNHQGFSVPIQMENETHWNATIAPHNTNTRSSGCIHRLCVNGTKPVGKPQQPLTSARFDIWLPSNLCIPIQHTLILQMMLAVSSTHLGHKVGYTREIMVGFFLEISLQILTSWLKTVKFYLNV